MSAFTKEQKDFLLNEFNLTESDISKMSEEEWEKVHDRCLDVILDEMLDENDEVIETKAESDRCNIAEDIIDIMYEDIHAA